MAKIKAHQRYKLSDGTIVPGTTSIIGSQLGWDRHALLAWTRKESLAGNDPKAMSKDAADSGTVCHLLVQAFVTGAPDPDLSNFTENQVKAGTIAFGGFQQWDSRQDLEYIHSELGVVSETWAFGGTVDLIGRDKDQHIWFVDLKTSRSIYPEMVVQLSAYSHAYEEQEGQTVDEHHILQLSKVDGSWQDHLITKEKIEIGWHVFKNCLALNEWQKGLS